MSTISHTLACLPFATSTSRRTVIAAWSTTSFPAHDRSRSWCRCGSNYGSGGELICTSARSMKTRTTWTMEERTGWIAGHRQHFTDRTDRF